MFANYVLGIVSCCLFAAAQAQTSDIIIFSDAGEKFKLVVDGEVKNSTPASRVEVRGIRNATPQLLVNFADPAIPSVKRDGWLEPGQEYTLLITTNKKGARVMRLQGQTPLAAAKTDEVAKPVPAAFMEDAPDPAVGQQTQVVSTPAGVSTTTTVTEGGADGNVNMSIDINGMGVNVKVNDGTTTTRTTTTTVTTNDTRPQPVVDAPAAPAVVPDGCGAAMAQADFAEALGTISDQGFDETKLSTAKQVAGSNCLSSAQVTAIMNEFGFEATKLDFAKFAYAHVSDRGNYFKVNKAFGFSSSVDELNKYIQGR